MKQEQVIELAKKAGFTVRKGEIVTPRLEHLPINEFVEKLASLVEQATLERAADAVSRVPVDICTYEALSAGYAAILNLAKESQ